MLIVSGRGVHIDGGGLFAIDGSTVEQLDNVSCSGLAYDGVHLARTLKTNPNTKRLLEVVVYDGAGVVRYQRIDESRDTHDLQWDGENLVVVATWYNAVRWFSPGGTMIREIEFPGQLDAWHLNCITNHDGVWYATAFGAFRTFRRWMPPTRAEQGRIIELETGRVVVEGLSAPHHPRWLDGEWIVCNSELKEVVACDASGNIVRRVDCGGWTRGLAFDDNFFYVGTSKRTSTEARATVAVVDRQSWAIVDRIPIDAQELYDIVIVPESIVDGVRTGFNTNPDRAKERQQWALLEELGCPKPRTLWPTGDPLRWEDFRATIEGTLPDQLVAGEYIDVPLRITNRSRDFFTTAPPLPIFLSYKWIDPETGTFADDRDAHRTWLPRTIYPNETIEIMARIITTIRPGKMRLRVSLVQEGRSWFDDVDPESALEADVDVSPEIPHAVPNPAPAVRAFTDRAPVAKRELGRLSAMIAASPLVCEPLPVRRVQDFFAPGTFAGMVEYFPDGSDHQDARTIDLATDTAAMRPAARAFWNSVNDLLSSAGFAQVLLDQFPETSRKRFGALVGEPSFAASTMRGTVVLVEGSPDAARALLQGRPGTAFTVCVTIDPMEASETRVGRANFAEIVAFDGSDGAVSGFSSEMGQPRARRRIIIEVLARNARQPADCAVTIVAGLPRTMPSNGAANIRYQLTNRSNLALVSALPCTTQVGYRWFDDKTLVAGGSTALPGPVDPGERVDGTLEIHAPERPGSYRLTVAVVQDGVAWFDDLDPKNGASATVTVAEHAERLVDDADLANAEEEPPEPGSDSGIFDDIVDGLSAALGDGWYPVEHENGVPFRWSEKNATIHAAIVDDFRYALNFIVEPGPGVGLQPFVLSARLADGTPLDRVLVHGRQRISIELPREVPRVFSIVLNAEEGGTPSGDDERVLNFRIFPVALEKADDVFPVWAEPMSGFYALERADGRLFRWVNGDATIALTQQRDTMLRLDVESGPGFESQPFTLVVLAADGSEITTATVGSRVTVEIPLDDCERFDSLILHADGGGAMTPDDERVLNFRVFANAHD